MAEVLCTIDGQIATVTLSNPGKYNALDLSMWQALQQHFVTRSHNDDLRCVVVRGANGHFASGADIAEFASVRRNREQGMHYHQNVIGAALNAISNCPHPTIAVIEGNCVGGGLEIAASCDLRIAAKNSRFGIPINRLGFPLAPMELQCVLALVGKAIALEMLLEGRLYDAQQARNMGLVRHVADDVEAELSATLARICAGAPQAARINKRLIARLTATAEALSTKELHAAFHALDSSDYQEGIAAFLDKRTPKFTGL